MVLVINDTPNPFLFSFTEPAANPGPDPKNFSANTTFTYVDTVPNSTALSFDLDPVTSNMGNSDRFGNNPALVSFGAGNTIAANGTTGGTVAVDIDVPFALYNRLGQGELLTMEWLLTVNAEGGQTDTTPVKIALTGFNDLPIAANDVINVTDEISAFTNGGVLANDDDPDINDVFAVTGVGTVGAATAGPGTVFPAEYVAQVPGNASFEPDSVTVAFNSYFKFLAPGESVTFVVPYTMSDGHGGFSTANIVTTITGTATKIFVGTKKADQMLGENDKDKMFGDKGNDVIYARAGNDKVFGDKGNDILIAGLGKDKQFGGKGGDIFRFMDAADSGPKGKQRDKIFDFKKADTIDVSPIDAKAGGGTDDAFKFIGKKAFHGKEGELRFDTKKGNVTIYADIDGDGKADFSLQLIKVSKVVAADFDL